MFNIKVHKWKGDNPGGDSYVKHEDIDESVYLTKWTDDYKEKYSKWIVEQNANLNQIIFNHPKVQKYITDNLMENGKIKEAEFTSFIANREYFNCFDMKTDYVNMIHQANQLAKKKLNFDWNTPAKFEAVLDKHQKIY